MIKPLNNNILLKPDKERGKTESGFVLPADKTEQVAIGIVEAVGKNADKELKKSQKVAYAGYSGSEIGEFILISDNDILGIIE